MDTIKFRHATPEFRVDDAYSPQRLDWEGRTVKGHIRVQKLQPNKSATGERQWGCLCLICGRGYSCSDSQLANYRITICGCEDLERSQQRRPAQRRHW